MKFKCLHCKSENIIYFNNLRNLKSKISSNFKKVNKSSKFLFCKKCKLFQKKITKSYIKNCIHIYKNYEKAFSFNEIDQKKSRKKNLFRSDILLNKLKKHLKFKKKIKILDYGSGKGAISNASLKFFKKKKIYAYDVENNLDEKINKKVLFINNLENKKFNLIFLSHVFEHLFDPTKVIQNLKKNMEDNAKLIIQVPNFKTSPYDIIVYDHVVHLTKENLINFFNNNGFKNIKVFENIFEKEIILVCEKNNSKIKKKKFLFNNKINKNVIQKRFWYIEKILNQIKREKSITFYGSSLLSNFLILNLDKNKTKKVQIIDDNYLEQMKQIDRFKIKICNLTRYKSNNDKIYLSISKKINSDIQKNNLYNLKKSKSINLYYNL